MIRTKITCSLKPLLSSAEKPPLSGRKPHLCGKCRSTHTVCLYHHQEGTFADFKMSEEFYCFNCSGYTQYIFLRVS